MKWLARAIEEFEAALRKWHMRYIMCMRLAWLLEDRAVRL